VPGFWPFLPEVEIFDELSEPSGQQKSTAAEVHAALTTQSSLWQ
jgi:hypothetical protein